MSDTLVLGAAIGYNAEHVRPFLVSLRNSGYRGDIALIADPTVMDANDPLLKGVTLVPAQQWAWGVGNRLRKSRFGQRLLLDPWQWLCWLWLRVLLQIPTRRAQQIAWAQWSFHPQLSRFFHYQRFLRTSHYQRVLLADVRDVIFQSDPFLSLPAAGLGVSIESRHYTLASQSWNALWLRTAYGEGEVQRIGGHPVSCSGVTCGDRATILRYVDLMVDEILPLNFRSVCLAGDQAMHNHLLWNDKLDAVTHLESLHSAVATLHDTEPTTLRFDAQGRLLNTDDSLVAVVHQYDRLPQIAGPLLKAVGAD